MQTTFGARVRVCVCVCVYVVCIVLGLIYSARWQHDGRFGNNRGVCRFSTVLYFVIIQ